MQVYTPFPKIARLKRRIVITEKIDGTHAAVLIERAREDEDLTALIEGEDYVLVDDFIVRAASRNATLADRQGEDNFGFCRWVYQHADELVELGEGVHRGEWWGHGIQRGYNLDSRRFSLFNVGRFGVVAGDGPIQHPPQCCHVVPTLYAGPWIMPSGEFAPDQVLRRLEYAGSQAAPGYKAPEGIIVFHEASGEMFKYTIPDDPKGQSA